MRRVFSRWGVAALVLAHQSAGIEVADVQRALPEGKLSLEAVVRFAVRGADSYRGLRADLEEGEVSRLTASAPFDPQLTASVGGQDDQREPQIPFMPNRTISAQFGLGLQTQFKTGTSLGVDLSHGLSDLRFATVPSNRFAETRATLRLSQKLLKDSFGSGTRAGVEAARLVSESFRARYREAREKWFIDLASLYYDSWTAQTLLRAAEKGLERRRRLLKIVRLRAKRGTSERPDLLQVKSAVYADQTNLAQARQGVIDRWRFLVTTLKLPAALASLDPASIPLTLESQWEANAIGEAHAACGRNKVPAPTGLVEQTRLLKEAADLNVEKAQSEAKPDLELSLGLGANSVAPNSSATFSDWASLRYPYVAAGLKLTLPWARDVERARLAEATVGRLRADVAATQAIDNHSVEWQNGCDHLARLKAAEETLAKALALQEEREKLEENRFRLGRGSVFQVIQAGDDVTQAEIRYGAARTAYRLALWRVQVRQGVLHTFLDDVEKTPTPGR